MKEYARRKQNTVSNTAGGEMSFSRSEAGNIPNSSMEAVMAGRAKASSEMMGHRQNLAPSLNAKMAKAFGMDLSNMQVYRSEAMSGTETEGLASGNKIVLSSDIDLNTTAGQAVLGHEISHVRAQNQGIGMGRSGLYQNAGLEHQADVEGMMAARGQSILGDSTGMDMGLGMGGMGGLTPMGAGMSASAGAPMQAKKGGKKAKSAAPAPVAAVPSMPEILEPMSSEPAVPAPVAPEAPAPLATEKPAPVKPAEKTIELGKPTVSPERAVKEKKFFLLNKLAGGAATGLLDCMDDEKGFDENYQKFLTRSGWQYKDTSKNNSIFKKLVQASLFTKQNVNDRKEPVNEDEQKEWYENMLVPGLQEEYIDDKKCCSIPLDYKEFLKSKKK